MRILEVGSVRLFYYEESLLEMLSASCPCTGARSFLEQHSNLITQIDEVKTLIGSKYQPILSDHEGEIKERPQSYGKHEIAASIIG